MGSILHCVYGDLQRLFIEYPVHNTKNGNHYIFINRKKIKMERKNRIWSTIAIIWTSITIKEIALCLTVQTKFQDTILSDKSKLQNYAYRKILLCKTLNTCPKLYNGSGCSGGCKGVEDGWKVTQQNYSIGCFQGGTKAGRQGEAGKWLLAKWR